MQRRHRKGAGLLPAAVEEIKRLRAEWAALKDSDLLEITSTPDQHTRSIRPHRECKGKKQPTRYITSEVLRGVVALVEVGTEPRALPLRAALAALGATVAPLWSPIVTHVVWSEGGDRRARAEARASAARLVSPLWVEACAASNRRLPEKTFPATTRPSDVPSPNTLLKLLKKAEKDNVPLADLLPNGKKQKNLKMSKPVSTVTSKDLDVEDSEDDTSCVPRGKPAGAGRDASTSLDTSANTSKDTTVDTSEVAGNSASSTDVRIGVNTNPRRALPKSYSPSPNRKKQKETTGLTYIHIERCPNATRKGPPLGPPPQLSRILDPSLDGLDLMADLEAPLFGRLFPPREPEISSESDNDPDPRQPQSELEDVARAERITKKRAEKKQYVNREQTMTYLDNRRGPGPCNSPMFIDRLAPYSIDRPEAPEHVPSQDPIHSLDGKLRIVATGMSRTERVTIYQAVRRLGGAKVQREVTHKTTHVVIGHFGKKIKRKRIDDITSGRQPAGAMSGAGNDESLPSESSDGEWDEDDTSTLRTLNALAGAARGCRVLYTQWAFDSLIAGTWLSHRPYIVPHLRNIAEKAYLERKAFNRMDYDYAYNIFQCRRVRLTTNAENRQSAEHLLALCGAVVVNDNGKITHNADLLEDYPETDLPSDIIPSVPWWINTPRHEDIPQRNGGSSKTNNRPQNGDSIQTQRTATAQGQRDKYPLRKSKNGRRLVWRMNSDRSNSEIVVGSLPGHVSSKWVFDSVAQGRMRSLRKYISSASG